MKVLISTCPKNVRYAIGPLGGGGGFFQQSLDNLLNCVSVKRTAQSETVPTTMSCTFRRDGGLELTPPLLKFMNSPEFPFLVRKGIPFNVLFPVKI
jgi:hypothetical protein